MFPTPTQTDKIFQIRQNWFDVFFLIINLIIENGVKNKDIKIMFGWSGSGDGV